MKKEEEEKEKVIVNLNIEFNPLNEWLAIECYYKWLAENSCSADCALTIVLYKQFLEGNNGKF